MRIRLVFVLFTLVVALTLLLTWYVKSARDSTTTSASTSSSPLDRSVGLNTKDAPEAGSTAIYAHNLLLRKGPNFRVYVRWLNGQLIRTRRDVNPSFDDPESFSLNVKAGVIRANIGDISNFLNASGIANSPLKHYPFR